MAETNAILVTITQKKQWYLIITWKQKIEYMKKVWKKLTRNIENTGN